jgi:predicted NBD/HSP70 family sugar kinase
VLDLVHSTRGCTRADLTRAIGLNRSTVATIVGELARMELVVVAEPGETSKRVGRPSSLVLPSDRIIAIAVNPEVDVITVAFVAMGGRVLRTFRFATERVPTARDTVNTVQALLGGLHDELDAHHEVVGIGVAVPGLVDARTGVVRLAPHLDWADEPLVDMLTEATGLPAWAANDATCGIVAEGRFGADAGVADVVYFNGGASGIGGGAILGGRLLSGRGGFSGELGHTLVNSAGVRCHCGSIGCLETEVQRSDLLNAVGLRDSQTDQLAERLTETYADDPHVRGIVDRQLAYLGVAIRNAVNAFNPEVVLLGGFLTSLFAVGEEALARDVAASALPGPAQDVRIVASQLGRENLLVGAAELVLQTVIHDPPAAFKKIADSRLPEPSATPAAV